MVMRTLTSGEFDVVYAAFAEAFSDYVVKFSPTREQLAEMFTRRGYVPEASVGVFDDGRLVAFTCNGIDGDAAYDTGTGVVPSHRGHGLAKQMMDVILPILRERGCTRYVLEVIEQNHAAHAVYRDAGFVETRPLQCWSLEIGGEHFERREAFGEFDIEPSWQNSTHSIARAKDKHVTVGNDDGFVTVFPNSGDLPQLFVRKEARRRGLGTRLLGAAGAIAAKPLRILNVDDRDEGIARFLEHAGAVRTVRQLEMERAL
jgi:GNAT superfamily N-acetyltransferase